MPSVSTEADICNLALGLLGVTQFIDSLNDSSTEAAACEVYYATTRDELLSHYDWSFARGRSLLGRLVETRDDWAGVYAAPPDMLVPRYIMSLRDRSPTEGSSIPFSMELSEDRQSRVILTDLTPAALVYTSSLTLPGLLPAYFVQALAAALAVPLAGALPVKTNLIPQLEQRANWKLDAAIAIDMKMEHPDLAARPELLSIRRQ